MSTRHPKDVVERFLRHGFDREADRWDMDVIVECFDVDNYFSHTWGGDLAETGRRQGAFFRAFSPDREILSEDLIAEGDRVVHRVTYRTTVTGSVLGVDVSERPATLTHIEMWRVTEGKIVEHWGGLGEAQHLFDQIQ